MPEIPAPESQSQDTEKFYFFFSYVRSVKAICCRFQQTDRQTETFRQTKRETQREAEMQIEKERETERCRDRQRQGSRRPRAEEAKGEEQS